MTTRKWASMASIPSDVYDDEQIRDNVIDYRIEESRAMIPAGCPVVSGPDWTVTRDGVPTTFNNHEGLSWWRRLFTRYREWTVQDYTIRVEWMVEAT